MLFRGIKTLLPNAIAKRSSGVYVDTECGKRFLDFSSGFGVTNIGHCHPAVVEATKTACEQLVHSQMSIMKHRPMMDLMTNLTNLEISKKSNFDSWYLWNSGTEAVEGACKLARQATKRPNIISMNGAYHGRTYLSMALTTSGTKYRANFGPLPSGVFKCPFPKTQPGMNQSINDNYWGYSSITDITNETNKCLYELRQMLSMQTSPEETAAIIVEPILGECGYIPAPPGFLTGLRKICNEHGILLIFDEVQTGFGRTGSMFACDWIDGGVSPDIIVMAKGLANGFPLSAIGTRKELSDKQSPGTMGGTYGGNAVACAAANAVFDVFRNQNILEETRQREKEIRLMVHRISLKHGGLVKEFRGRGLMVGLELNNSDKADLIANKCCENGLLLLTSGPKNVIRLIPALTITDEELKTGLTILEDVIASVG